MQHITIHQSVHYLPIVHIQQCTMPLPVHYATNSAISIQRCTCHPTLNSALCTQQWNMHSTLYYASNSAWWIQQCTLHLIVHCSSNHALCNILKHCTFHQTVNSAPYIALFIQQCNMHTTVHISPNSALFIQQCTVHPIMHLESNSVLCT